MTNAAPSAPALDLERIADELADCGRLFHSRGWSVGTSSNYSAVLSREPLELLVTASGMDKGRLTRADFVRVGADGRPTSAGQPKSSAETMLHVVLADERSEVGGILHTHSVWTTILSDHYFGQGFVEFSGFEMLKGFAGIGTHETTVRFRIFENTQDIGTLAEEVRKLLKEGDESLRYGYLLRKHGLYTWGKDVQEARRHVEILEFLLECEWRRLALGGI
ncbi:MAG TPA: methylthioribulose 1-phosphate dehydratase [Pirellulaceae bacterium]|jgi:methylthioribulose-1-phosphate dehydratase|nr:methylthioribulose 1-phosphate dehydratase [Pirellulaceae bacterium]